MKLGLAARAAVLLASVAGGVDAVGFLTLSRLFTANMSGNTVALAVGLGQGDAGTVIERGVPIGVFLIGVMLGTAAGEIEQFRGIRHPFLSLYTLEALLLALFWFVGDRLAPVGGLSGRDGWPFYTLATLATLAMGLQSATLNRADRRIIHTTFISGVITSVAQSVVHLLLRTGRSDPSGLYTGVWIAYLVGAVVATLIHVHAGYISLLLPLAGLCVVVVIDTLNPHEIGGPPA